MDFKLIAFGLVFGIAALVIFAANRANTRATRPGKGPPLDTQIGTLAEMGLHLSPGLSREDLLAWGPEETYRADPWRLILLTYASPADHRDNRPFCPCAAMIDVTPTTDRTDLADMCDTLARVAGLTPGPRDPDGDRATVAQVAEHLDRALPEDTHLWALDNGETCGVFRLRDDDARTLNSFVPGLLGRLAP